jgi:uncharacterized protein YaaR (DUF327 family)
MSSRWQKLTDKDEIAKIIEDISSKPLEIAPPSEEIQSYSEIVERFITLVLDCSYVFISDESSLYDFEIIEEVNVFEERIKEVFGVDVSDIEDKNLLKIFERISSSF